MWAVVEVSAGSSFDGSGAYWFDYKVVHAVADLGPLRVSMAHPSSSKSLCFDVVLRHLLTSLDLSSEGFPDPHATMAFLIDAHTNGLPPGLIPDAWLEDRNTPRPFSERLLAAMAPQGAGDFHHRVPPMPRLVKSFVDAEHYAAEYMRYLGFDDATSTPPGSDGGVDVVSSRALGQVKMEGVATGRPVVQAIFGIASLERKQAVVFSLAGYTAQALEWAEKAGVACFEFNVDGSVEPITQTARDLS